MFLNYKAAKKNNVTTGHSSILVITGWWKWCSDSSELIVCLAIYIGLLFFYPEPNNDSPLNCQAADLWKNQVQYKAILMEQYAKAIKNCSDSWYVLILYRSLQIALLHIYSVLKYKGYNLVCAEKSIVLMFNSHWCLFSVLFWLREMSFFL